MKKIITVTIALLCLAACNTIEGAGEDINSAGKAISNSAVKTKQAISK